MPPKYIIQVREEIPATPGSPTEPAYREIFMLGVEEFDPLTFCAALKQKTRGRKPGKKGEQSP